MRVSNLRSIIAASFCFVVGTLGAYTVTATSITFDYSDRNNAVANRQALEAFIASIENNSSSTTKSIFFADSAVYKFELNPSSGQMIAFSNVHNLVISGVPGSVIEWSCSVPPSSFFRFKGTCHNVEIKDLTFTTSQPPVTQPDGCHLKISGTGFSIHDNMFTASPGFAIQLTADENGARPSNIHIDENIIINTYADGINIGDANDIWVVGNVIMHTGDDALAVYGTNTYDIHLLANIIDSSSWRGINVESADYVYIEDNVITGTCAEGIRIETMLGTATALPPADFAYRSNYVLIRGNRISGVGTVGAHFYTDDDGPGPNDDPIYPNINAIFCRNVANISIDLADNSFYGGGIEPGYSLVGYPPSYTPAYYSVSSTNWGVLIYHALYGVISNYSNVSGSPAGQTNAVTNWGQTTPDADGNILWVNP